jgi:hypothetical protein
MSEPEGTIRDVLLTEPGSKVEGPTEDILRTVFWAVESLLCERGMTEQQADSISLQLMARIHDHLADQGFVVRDYAR